MYAPIVDSPASVSYASSHALIAGIAIDTDLPSTESPLPSAAASAPISHIVASDDVLDDRA